MVKTARKIGLPAFATASLLMPTPVLAQSVGTYGGQQANGQPISIIVTRYQGKLIVNVVNFGQVTATCRNGSVITQSLGVGGAEPIKNGAGHFGINFGPSYIHMSYTFDDSTHSVSGFFTQAFGQFSQVESGAPKKATFCPSGRIGYAAALQKAADFNPATKFVHYGCAAANGGSGPCVANGAEQGKLNAAAQNSMQ